MTGNTFRMCEAHMKVGSQDFECYTEESMDSKFLADAASYAVKFQSSCCAEGKDL